LNTGIANVISGSLSDTIFPSPLLYQFRCQSEKQFAAFMALDIREPIGAGLGFPLTAHLPNPHIVWKLRAGDAHCA
jgi:hypothetical protein